MLGWWKKRKQNEPINVYVLYRLSACKAKLIKRLDNGKVIIKEEFLSKMVANADGSYPSPYSYKQWVFENNSNYNSAKILEAILANEKVLPILMGIDEDLDRVISERLGR
jgi:hypothetical protein